MKKYIITDPCYIIDGRQYDAIGNALGWGRFAEMKVPSEYSLDIEGDKEGVKIVIHKISGTPNGDGSCEYLGQSIGVDAGMLCIAECEDGWASQKYGATFDTLGQAIDAFQDILEQF